MAAPIPAKTLTTCQVSGAGDEMSPFDISAAFMDDVDIAVGEDLQEFDEVMVADMMHWLANEISSTVVAPAEIPSGDKTNSFVTVNGNDESCGPSFSVVGTTVMASIDTRGGGVVPYFFAPAPFVWNYGGVAASVPKCSLVAGDDYDEDDGTWLSRVLGVVVQNGCEETK